MVGDLRVGKTCLSRTFAGKTFAPGEYVPTTTTGSELRIIGLNKTRYSLTLWDTQNTGREG